jgi:RpiB/LacA/LacB family sugar-phosphate isomerase
MDKISESELQELVQQIVNRTLGDTNAVSIGMNAGKTPEGSPQDLPGASVPPGTTRRIALGADHGGYTLKESLKPFLQKQGYQLDDCGTHSAESVDYPDFAYAVAKKVSDGEAWRGIIIDGAGIGSCMVANKVPGVRAAMCYNNATAVNSREHNKANVLTLGAGMIDTDLAHQIVMTWLNTNFGGGRHARRVDKIDRLDKNR